MPLVNFNWLIKKAKDDQTKKAILKIKEWHSLAYDKKIFQKSDELMKLNLLDNTIWLRQSGAYSSLDIYYEIFKERGHSNHPLFSGKDAKVVFDLGANEGFYTLKIKDINHSCKIFSIEPNPFAFQLLKKNIRENNLKNVVLINKAVGKSEGKINFQIVKQISAIGGKDMMEVPAKPWLMKKMVRTIKVSETTIQTIMSKFRINKIDILKIDVEGAELEILLNMPLSSLNIRKIVIEYHSQNIRSKLKEYLPIHNFKLVQEDIAEYDCGDLYFIKSKARCATMR